MGVRLAVLPRVVWSLVAVLAAAAACGARRRVTIRARDDDADCCGSRP